ncbi:hypothetical protein [Belnapia moabensis]|uniref:hypothetical protein n=1 Tax=Belnapia moabensis TaxID=365533 RepID=UPI0005BA7227|nr:hypothetical protein [Belnapia moabensis]
MAADPAPGGGMASRLGREIAAGYAAGRAADRTGAAAPVLPLRGADSLLPSLSGPFVLAFALAVLRPDARRWLGRERLRQLAAKLGLKDAALTSLLDAVPQPPAALGESVAWAGRRVPLLAVDGRAEWIELFWRPDRRGPDRGGFAVRLRLPVTGRIEIRGRLEGLRLDAVMETQHPLPKPLAFDVTECFAAALLRLGLEGCLTLRHAQHERRT